MKVPAPKPTGEYAVGTFTFTVKDDRPEVMDASKMRSIAARVYYPVRKDRVQGCHKSRYLSRNMALGLKKNFWIPINYDKLEASGENTSECYEAAPKPEGERFPLILFNHGLASFREGNSFLCIELASHGYVVISVAHSLEGICTEFDDGSFIPFDKTITKKTYDPYLGAFFAAFKLIGARGTNEELSLAFDRFQDKYSKFLKGRLDEWVKDDQAALKYAKENLSDMLDLDKGVGVAGHSFGGDTAYRLCTDYPEYVCGVNIDGAMFGDYSGRILDKPFLQISCKSNENMGARVYLKHTKPVWKVLFRDMQHVGFSDMKHMMGFGVGKLHPDVMHENLCRCHLEMFDTYLKRSKPEPELKSNDAVKITRYEPDL